MNKLNRLKAAVISGAVALTSIAGSLSAVVSPSLSATAADSDNYAKLLQYSLYLYDANMCGTDVNTNGGLSWRGNCHTDDEVPGGFHDAGDHVMFGQPQGYTAATLGWAYYEFKDAFEATGQGAHLKVITDKFAKFFRDATVLNGDSVSKVLIEKGEGGPDHDYWGAPETQGYRGRMLWSTGGAANITAEYAAALAANYVNFGNPDDLKYAKALYNFSKQNPATYSCEFYGSGESGSADELAWAAGWLYLATNDGTYKNDLNNCPEGWWVHNWENVALGASILKGEITGDWSGVHELGGGSGYKFYDKWGSARHNATAQFCSLVAAKHNKADSSWAKGQMEYITGDKPFANGQSYCLVVGLKSNASSHPHHRAASGTSGGSEREDSQPSAHVLVGALCGGPSDANGTYQDKRSDYVCNEVACDYNAGFVGAAAGLYHFYKTGSIDTNIDGVTKIYSGSSSTVITTQQNPSTTTTTRNNPSYTTTTTGSGSSSGGDTVLTEDDMTVGTEKGDDGATNNYAEFKPGNAKSATLYLKVNSNDTEVSGAFGTWTGEWVQEDFTGVKVGSDKTVAIDYTFPSKVGQTIKAMVFWPHGNDVTIQKVVLHSGSGSSTPATTTTTRRITTTTTTRDSGSSSGGDTVLTEDDMTVGTEKGDDGATNNYAEFKPGNAKSATLYLKVNSNDTEVSGAFGTWTGEWVQEDFTGVKVGSDKTVAIDYTFPSKVGQTIKAMVFWPHGDDVTIQKIVLHGGSGSSTPATTTTTRRTTTTTTTRRTTTTTTTTKKIVSVSLYGDSNCDGGVDLADAVLIMQALANPNKYGVGGSDRNAITEAGAANADVHQNGNGITSNDALAIQKFLLGLVSRLPARNL